VTPSYAGCGLWVGYVLHCANVASTKSPLSVSPFRFVRHFSDGLGSSEMKCTGVPMKCRCIVSAESDMREDETIRLSQLRSSYVELSMTIVQ
jgi:hypothetical protein